ncbi:MAG TPA: DsbC family protein [Burkholderiales bacterium]|nr:DsbC family protein [Burkholderiales bacterium]
MTAVAVEIDEKPIRAGLARMLPKAPTDSFKVRPTPVPGLVEVEIDSTVFYMTADGKHVLSGDLLDTEKRTNLTDVRRQAISVGVLNGMSEKNMIVMGPKDAKRTITVFTDVDCGYCRRLQTQDVPELTKQGVKVRYLLYPRTAPGTESYNRSIAVWCAPNRIKAVEEGMAGKSIAMKTCPNPIADIHALGEKLAVSGTPAIFFDDGQRLPGYVPADEMLSMLGMKQSGVAR